MGARELSTQIRKGPSRYAGSTKGELEAGKTGIRGWANGLGEGVPGGGAGRAGVGSGRGGLGAGLGASGVNVKGFEKGFAFQQGAFVVAEGTFGF
jgi:hypothetical protein